MNEKMEQVINGTQNDEFGTTLTGDAIDHLRFTTLLSSYIFEIKTGMKTCQVPLSYVASSYGVTARNKKTALRELLKIYEATYGVKFAHRNLEAVLGK